jgi:hypothetical protein
MTSATKNFHLVRAGLNEWHRARRREQIAAYARPVAGSSEDLDPELERAGVEALLHGCVGGMPAT